MLFSRSKTRMVAAEDALAGRPDYGFAVAPAHHVNGRSILPPFPDGLEHVIFGMGCFWGAEKTFWNTPGVWTTAVGYAGGFTPYPSYDETCTGLTGHTEAVLVVYDPTLVSFAELLSVFFENHDPTQGNRQGNDVGTQYRSAIYYNTEAQHDQAVAAKAAYTAKLATRRIGPVTSEIAAEGPFYYAEREHQQYLAKNPAGYCPDHGTGVSCPVGLFA